MIFIVSVKSKESYFYTHSIFEGSWHLGSFNIILEIKNIQKCFFKKKTPQYFDIKKNIQLLSSYADQLVTCLSNYDSSELHFGFLWAKYHKIHKPARIQLYLDPIPGHMYWDNDDYYIFLVTFRINRKWRKDCNS